MLLYIVCITAGGRCYASCSVTGTGTNYVSFSNVVVQRDTPVGTVVGVALAYPLGKEIAICNSYGGYGYYKMDYYGAQPSGIANVYKTNVPGIGISLKSPQGYYYTSPASVAYELGPVALWDQQVSTISLVKIGDVTSGVLMTGLIGTYSLDSVPAIWTNLSSGSIVAVACSISTPSLTFPIGNVPVSSFGTTVGTTPSNAQNTQNLGLNCDANANINVKLSGTQHPDVSTTSVLALTGQGNEDVAKGVGVQLLYNGSPLVLNNRIVLKKSSGGQETFPLTARFYQTKTSVTAGKANASATLDLTYQ